MKVSRTGGRPVNCGLSALTHNNKKNPKGWLRDKEARGTNEQLNDEEKRLALALCHALRSLSDTSAAQVAHAWGITPPSIKNIAERASQSGTMSTARKVRSDAGKTVFNSDKMRDRVFSTWHAFDKLCRAPPQNRGDKLTQADIKLACENETAKPTSNLIVKAEKLAADQRQRSTFLTTETEKCLKSTDGSVTWQRLATAIAGEGNPLMANKDTIWKFVMSLPNSSCQTTRLHPLLNAASRQQRREWAHQFWLFWNTAKVFEAEVQILLVHMDEKWFCCVIIWKNNKRVPFLGVEPVQHAVHHKSHLHKILCIASSGVLPTNNNIEQGGAAAKVSLERAGRMMPAQKDSCRQVHKPDGAFHYPGLQDNLSRKKGELCFEPMEITGSTEGTAKKPKCSLLKFHKETEMPRLEQIAQQIETETMKKCVIRCQIDGAGPHTDKKLLAWLQCEFNKCGWTLKFQPPNSPLTNIKDCCVFPAMSKAVTAEQGLFKGSHALEGEDFWNVVQRCWQHFHIFHCQPLQDLSLAIIRL